MKIKQNYIVTMHYSMKNSDGLLLETTQNGWPAQLICGAGLFLPALEKALIGLKAGDQKTIIISPEDGYGKIDEALIFKMHRSELPEIDAKVGGKVWRGSSFGDKVLFKITGFLKDWVFLNGNHPLAGHELHYNVKILSVKDSGNLKISTA